MTEIQFLIVSNLVFITAGTLLFIRTGYWKNKAEVSSLLQKRLLESLTMCRKERDRATVKCQYYKDLADKFIRLNNKLCDATDELIDKRKFNGTKHKQR